MCFTLRLHMSAAPTQGGLTQALGLMTVARKVDIAKQYIEDSLRLYSESRFLSALTLAGAAEEMLGKSLERSEPNQNSGVSLRPVTALDKEAAAMAAFDQQLASIGVPNFTAKSLSEIKQELIAPRNSAKHFNNKTNQRSTSTSNLRLAP